jgi:hypothetical protein
MKVTAMRIRVAWRGVKGPMRGLVGIMASGLCGIGCAPLIRPFASRKPTFSLKGRRGTLRLGLNPGNKAADEVNIVMTLP